MNGQAGRFIAWALVTLLIGGGYYYLTDQERRIAEAEAKAVKAEETARQLIQSDTDRIWSRLDQLASELETAPKDAKQKELTQSLKQELQKVRGRYRFEQLGR